MTQIIRYGIELPEKRAYIAGICVPANRLPDTLQTFTSPNRKYRLETCQYHHGEHYWNYSVGTIIDVKTNQNISEIQRNWSTFWHAWITHPDGSDYLLCGEDYQGYTVLNLTTQVESIYLPEGARQGGGFCWSQVSPSPDGTRIAVDGCYWAVPYDLVIYDFTNPSILPLPELYRRGKEDLVQVGGWTDNDHLSYTVAFTIRISDGAKYSDLSDQEQSELDKDESLQKEIHETRVWSS